MRAAILLFVVAVFSIPVFCGEHDDALFAALETGNHDAAFSALSRGATANARNKDGETPLHVCARKGDGVMLLEFIRLGAALNVQDNDGRTAMHRAYIAKNLAEVITLSEHGADPRIKDLKEVCLLALAEANEDWPLVEILNKNAPKAHPDMVECELIQRREVRAGGSLFPFMLIPVAFVIGFVFAKGGSSE